MNILANAIDALEESLASNESQITNDKGQIILPTITIRTKVLDRQWAVIRIADNAQA